MILLHDGSINEAMSFSVWVDTICTQQGLIFMLCKKGTPDVYDRDTQLLCQQQNFHVVHLLPAVNRIDITQPVQNVVGMQVAGNPLKIPLWF